MLSVLPLAHNLEEGTIISQYFSAILARKNRNASAKAAEPQEAKEVTNNKPAPAPTDNVNFSNQSSNFTSEDLPSVEEAPAVADSVGSKFDVIF